MGEEEVRIPIFLDLNDADVAPKLSKLKSAIKDILDTKGTQIKNPFDAWQLTKAIKDLEAIREKVHAIGEENLSDKQFIRLRDATFKNLETLDRLINKYDVLKNAMIGVPKNWVNTDNAKELTQYIDALNSRLQQTRDRLDRIPENVANLSPAISDNAKALSEELQTVDGLIAKIGEYQKKLAEAEQNARSRTRETTAMKQDGSFSQEAIAAQEEIAKSARDAYSQMEKDSAEATSAIKRDIQARIKAILEEEKALDKSVIAYRESYKGKNLPVKGPGAEASSKSAEDAQKAAQAATRAQIKELNAEAAAIKQTTSQYYYKLRSIKMLGFVINQVNNTLGNLGKKTTQFATKALSAYLKLIPGVNALKKALDKTSTSQKKLNREVKSTTKSHEGFNISLKKGLMTILKYGLGIRSLYVLINKLRKAITEGIGEMSKQFDDVNSKMSIILTEINYMKASLTAMVQPIINLLAPAFEKLSAVVAKISYQVSSFVALLTGQDYVYKAIKIQADYAASLDKTGKSAKKAKKELAGFDELNVLHSDNDDDDTSGLGWEIVPAMEQAAGWIDKIKDMLSKLLEPFKNAWENMRDFVLSSWNTMVKKLKSLLGTIWDDFLKVWTDGRVQKIFEDILRIVGDIFLIIGNIAEAIEEAWKYNDNGYRSLSAIVNIIGIIVAGLKECADYTVLWSEKLSFVPLFSAIADVLEQQVVPAVQKVVDLFVYLYENIFLEIVRYVVEELAPILVKVFGNIVETIGNIAENIRTALEENDRGAKILQQIETLVTIVANGILDASEKTKEWAKNLDFAGMFDAILNFLTAIQPMVQFLVDTVSAFWTEVLLPFWSYLVEDGGPKLLEMLSQIFGQYNEETGMGIDWEHLTEVMHRFMTEVAEPMLELAWDVLIQLIKDLGQAFDDFANSGTLDIIIDKFSEWIQNADPEDIAHKLETLVEVFIGLKAAFALVSHVILPVVTGFMTLGNVLMQHSMAKSLGEISAKVAALSGSGAAAGGGGFAALASSIGPVIIAIVAVVAVIATMVAAFGGVENTLAEIKERFDKVKEAVSQFVEKINFSETVERLKETFGRLGDSAEKLRPIFEFLLDALGSGAQIMIEALIGQIDGFLTVLDGAVNIISGVFDIIGGLVEAIIGLVTGDEIKKNEGLEAIVNGIKEIFYGLLEAVEGVFLGIAEAIAGVVDQILPGVSKSITDFCNDVKEAFAWLKHVLIGDPIVYDIRDGVVEGFGEFVSETWDKITGWVGDVKGKFVELKDGLVEKATTIKDGVVNGFTALKEGLLGQSDEATTDTTSKFTTLKDNVIGMINTTTLAQAGTDFIQGFKTAQDTVLTALDAEDSQAIANLISKFVTEFTPTTISEQGTQFIQGFSDAAIDMWKILHGDTDTNILEVIKQFTSQFTLSTLVSVGADLIQGLINGLMSKLQEALNRVTAMCNAIIAKVKQAFSVHSPSKVFEEIGNFLGEGLAIGIEDETEDVADAFENIVPTDVVSDDFAVRFVNMLATMKDNAVSVVEDMSDQLGNVMDNLDLLSSMDMMYNRINKMGKIKMPDVAMGNVIPANAKLAASNMVQRPVDTKQMAESVKSAMLEAMTEMQYNNTDNGDTVIQIDGYEVFRAVRNQSDIFRNATGYGVL